MIKNLEYECYRLVIEEEHNVHWFRTWSEKIFDPFSIYFGYGYMDCCVELQNLSYHDMLKFVYPFTTREKRADILAECV